LVTPDFVMPYFGTPYFGMPYFGMPYFGMPYFGMPAPILGISAGGERVSPTAQSHALSSKSA